MSTVVRTDSCFTTRISYTCHKYGIEELSDWKITPPWLGFTICRWALLLVENCTEGIRKTDWSESAASILYRPRRNGNRARDFAENQPGVRKIDRVDSYRRRLEVSLPRAVQEATPRQPPLSRFSGANLYSTSRTQMPAGNHFYCLASMYN